MNKENKEFFFGDEDEVAVVTITDGDGNPLDIEVLAALEIEEYEKEYVAAFPAKPSEKYPENNLIVLVYSEDEEGNPQFGGITDKQELRDVSNLFLEYFSS